MAIDITISIDPLNALISIGLIYFLYRWAKWERSQEEKRTIVELIRQALDADPITKEDVKP